MHLLRIAAVACIASLHLLAGAAQAAVGDLQGVSCDVVDGVEHCSIQIAPGTTLEGPVDAWAPHSDANGFEFDNGAQRLSVRFCDPLAEVPGNLLTDVCFETIRGTNQLQLPQIGFLESLATLERPLVTMGMDTGENLAADPVLELAPDLVAMLDDENRYAVYLNDTAGFTASIPGLEFIELSAGGDRTAVVVGMNELFLYYEGELPGLPKKEDDDDSDSTDTDSDSGSDGSSDSGSDSSSDPNADSGSESGSGDGSDPDPNTDPNGEGDPNADPNAEEEPEEEEEENPDGAVAIKFNGGIPFTPLRSRGVEADMTPFEGHIYVKGPVPVATGFEVDGTLVFDVDPDDDGDHPFEPSFYESVDLRIGANGTLQMAIPVIEIPELALEFGDATVIGMLSDDRDALTFSGIVSPDEFFGSLPLPLGANGVIEGWGRFVAQDVLGTYAHLEGEMGVDGEALGALLGLELGTIQSADAVMDISAAGLTLQGSTSSALHPDLAPNGSIGMLVHVGADPSNWAMELQGDLTVAGQGLRDGVIRVDANGVTVQGILLQGGTEFFVLGNLGPDGLRIEGQVELAPIAANGAARELAALGVSQALDQVETAQAQVDAASSTVGAAQSALSDAQSALASANSALSSANSSLSYHKGKYSYHSSKYSYWKKKSCKRFDVSCKAKRSSKKAYYSGKKAYYASKVTLYNGIVAGAKATVSAAQASVNAAQSALDAAQAELASLQASLATKQALLAQAEAALASLPVIDAEIEMIVSVIFENGAFDGAVDATMGGAPLAGGTLTFGNPGTACVTIPGSPEICQPF